MAIETGTITANDLEFAYLADGPEDGPLALCLHGFPDTAWSFRHLLPALADAGFRAVIEKPFALDDLLRRVDALLVRAAPSTRP